MKETREERAARHDAMIAMFESGVLSSHVDKHFDVSVGTTYHLLRRRQLISAPEATRKPASGAAALADVPASAWGIEREPCPMCGVRGDIGCKHRRPELERGA